MDDEFPPAERDPEATGWEYVGRFLAKFAVLESGVYRLLAEVFNLQTQLDFLLVAHLDLRRKIAFVEAALKVRDTPRKQVYKEALKEIHKLHDVRNLLAHGMFADCGDGIEFESGSKTSKPGPHVQKRDDTFLGNFIAYSELDSLEQDMLRIEAYWWKWVARWASSLRIPIFKS